MKFFKVLSPAPVLNSSNFDLIFSPKIPTDENGHPQSYEFVALTGMCFQIIAEMPNHILEITYPEYGSKPLYIDRRFGVITFDSPQNPLKPLLASQLLEFMEQMVGVSYVWGGNWSQGIPEMLNLYKPVETLDPRTKELWMFKGVDCSGLLFEASNWQTPRNTSALIDFGMSIDTEYLCSMDMIVYPGHVLFVRDEETIIESKSPFGVRIQSLVDRLDEIQAERSYVPHWSKETDPATSFTIRRFAVDGERCGLLINALQSE
jgi:hypothetical protein